MNDDVEEVILIDIQDQEIGYFPKLEAHRQGLLHRAISICVLDFSGRMLLQRRASGKYHSGGLWTNTCCTHPRMGETLEGAASRRMYEELGISCELNWILRTHYQAPVGGGLVENEVVHLFQGLYGGEVKPNPAEVDSVAWVSRKDLLTQLEARPDDYTYWFKYYMRSFADKLFVGAVA